MHEKLDILLGEALERLVGASGVIDQIPEIQSKPNKKNIGRAIANIWEVRNKIYDRWPELKATFVEDYETDEDRYMDLHSKIVLALKFEENGEFDLAELYYTKLRSETTYGYFRMQAEAGLFRINEARGA